MKSLTAGACVLRRQDCSYTERLTTTPAAENSCTSKNPKQITETSQKHFCKCKNCYRSEFQLWSEATDTVIIGILLFLVRILELKHRSYESHVRNILIYFFFNRCNEPAVNRTVHIYLNYTKEHQQLHQCVLSHTHTHNRQRDMHTQCTHVPTHNIVALTGGSQTSHRRRW